MTNALSRFLRYVVVDTTSHGGTGEVPSTSCQWDLAHLLCDELKGIGLQDVKVDEFCIVTATLPANRAPEGTPVIGFLAHMDTVSPGKNVKPRVIDEYDGEDILLNGELNVVLSPTMFPEMKSYIGKRLVVTDGTTVLGADNKAGVAAIVTAMDELIHDPECSHGKIRIAFTPDEEIGAGTDHFDPVSFGVDFGYTMDGGGVGGFQYENFNAAHARIIIHGNSIHPGSAKGRLKHASTIAGEFMGMIPEWERAETTEDREGFIHLTSMSGEVEKAELRYIIRDFDVEKLQELKAELTKIGTILNGKYGSGTVEVLIQDDYRNMVAAVSKHPEVVTFAKESMASLGIEMKVGAIRGGTDGANISNMENGFPCPNVSAGGNNGHGKFEFLVEDHLLTAVEVIKRISMRAAGTELKDITGQAGE